MTLRSLTAASALAGLLLLAPVGEASAQEVTGCFRGRPLESCNSFWITESFVGLRSVSGATGYSGSARTTFGGTVGWMKNRDDGSAIGGTIEISDVGITLAPRYRKWIGTKTAVDVSLGPRWEPGRIEVVDLTTSLMWSDLVGVTTAVAHDFGRGSSEFRLGVRSGSWIGVTTYTAALASVITWIILWDPD